jgi:hypothetical protein
MRKTTYGFLETFPQKYMAGIWMVFLAAKSPAIKHPFVKLSETGNGR